MGTSTPGRFNTSPKTFPALLLEIDAISSRSGASTIPLASAEPAQPVAPATQIRMLDMVEFSNRCECCDFFPLILSFTLYLSCAVSRALSSQYCFLPHVKKRTSFLVLFFT